MESDDSETVVLSIPNPPVAEATKFWCQDVGEFVKLREVDSCPESIKTPLTIHTFLSHTVLQYPDENALAYKEDPKEKGFQYITYAEYYESICTLAKAFIKLGLQEGKSVCLLGFNCPQWFLGSFGAIFAGGLSCGIYTTNSPDACRHVMKDSGCEIILVENKRQLEKILQIRSQVPQLKKIIVWTQEEDMPKDDDILSWEELINIGEKEEDTDLITRLKKQVPNQCCSLIYTSGTTGDPKGVMLSQDNITFTARWIDSYYQWPDDEFRLISYLPLSHIAGQLCDMYLPTMFHACVYFADPDALRGTLRNTLLEVRPTHFLGVPRVYEKMQERMLEVGSKMGSVAKWISSWAKSVGYYGNIAAMNGTPKPWMYPLASAMVLSKAKQALGLNKSRVLVTAAAPITKETLDYFMSLDMPIMEVYGMSESCGPQTFNKPDAFRLCSVGRCPDGGVTKIDKPDEDGNGEICMFGRHVFMGYLRAPEKTKETLDEDGWLHSGDIGKLDEDGFLYITGRIKELIITAGGENVAPVPIEDRIRACLPCISNTMLIGDKRKFISVLLTFKTLIDEESGMPKDELVPTARSWISEQIGENTITTVTELRQCNHPALQNAIEKALKKVNEQSVSRAAYVQKYLILPRDFSLPGGELGPTMKARRGVIVKMYDKEIQELYDADGSANAS